MESRNGITPPGAVESNDRFVPFTVTGLSPQEAQAFNDLLSALTFLRWCKTEGKPLKLAEQWLLAAANRATPPRQKVATDG